MANNDPVILDNSVNITIRDPNMPEQQSKKVVQGSVKRVQKKEKASKKFVHAFFGQDVENPGEYIVDQYLVPTGLRMLNNAGQTILKHASDGLQMLLFGKVVNQQNGPTDYTSFSSNGQQPMPRAQRILDAVDTFVFGSKMDAERVLADMRGRINAYGSVSVLDYYDAIGSPIDNTAYVLKDRGWTNLDNARVVPIPEGFTIDLPRPISLRG